MRSKIIAVLFAVIVSVLAIYLMFLSETPSTLPPLPDPNGYDALLAAATNLAGNFSDAAAMDDETLRQLVAINSNTLHSARAAVSLPCGVPVEFSPRYMASHGGALAALRHLAQALAVEARMSEINGRTNDAASQYLDVIHFGIEIGHGGTLIDELVGLAVEGIGTRGLQRLETTVGAEPARNIALTLETLDSERQSWNEVVRQEQIWSRHAFPGPGNRLLAWFTPGIRQTRQNAQQRYKTQQAATRGLRLAFAAAAYEKETGKRPGPAADLVPKYLKAVPLNPATDKLLELTP